jgi:hypothetical protein
VTLPITIRLGAQAGPSDLYHVKTDAEVGRTNRSNMPMIWFFAETPGAILNKEWQFYLRAINPGMSVNALTAHLHYQKVVTNQQGFGMDGDPRRNYLKGEDLDAVDREGNPAYPRMPKTFTFGEAIVQIKNGFVTTLDGRQPPPLKPAYSQPRVLAEAWEDIYLYTPRTHPHLFARAVTSVKTAAGEWVVRSFPNAALYPWYQDGNTPAFFLPHVSMNLVPWPPQQIDDNTARVRPL